MRPIDAWLNEYGESHQNPTNKLVHWICVPSIFFSIVGLLYGVKLPLPVTDTLQLNLAMVILGLVTLYYLRLSVTLAIGLLIFSGPWVLFARKIEDQ